MDTYNREFSVASGIAYQQVDLRRWEAILKPEEMEKLRRRVEAENGFATSGYDICRGDRIYEIIANELMPRVFAGECPDCGRSEGGVWFVECPSDDCPSLIS